MIRKGDPLEEKENLDKPARLTIIPDCTICQIRYKKQIVGRSHCLEMSPSMISKDGNTRTVVIKQMVSQMQKHACLSHLLTDACLPGIVWSLRGGYSIRQTGSQPAQVGPDVD